MRGVSNGLGVIGVDARGGAEFEIARIRRRTEDNKDFPRANPSQFKIGSGSRMVSSLALPDAARLRSPRLPRQLRAN